MSFDTIIKNIRNHELDALREPESVKLIAVSKVQPIKKIEKILKLGHLDFGENRVQEACSKNQVKISASKVTSFGAFTNQ